MPEEPDATSIFEECPSCRLLMDMSDVAPFSEVTCPGCGKSLRARKQFNHFTIIEKVGEGGMGSVYKALDNNLNRHVALKILKKEISSNPEEQEKLSKEAHITASVNHPNVVKVYHFGRDHGQFYLAMELVEKGSLDDLMTIQKRVSEAQVLEVGTQIAMGLAAALELELIHRDIKPGNILFKDAHTAKLVDFGLAIVMDEEASGRGEIWGTPYYIAPEKLDSQPEDFRSDIYSLGGTLFHALAGRPPYEADSPSMVALKQLKSQQVSLQAFAPDVSSETAYVINRMMAKKPEDRYQSYEELIGHLTYAREKLLERARQPLLPKQRVVMETEETRNVSAIISLIFLVLVVLGGGTVYLMRGSLFPATSTDSAPREISAQEAKALFLSAVSTLSGGDYEGAKNEFQKISHGMPQPQKNWSLMNAALACLLLGETQPALEILDPLKSGDLDSMAPEEKYLANFFVEVSRTLLEKRRIREGTSKNYEAKQEAFALLIFAIWDWEAKSAFSDAGPLLELFLEHAAAGTWEASYKPIAEKYLADWHLLEPAERALSQAMTPEAATAQLGAIREARTQTQTGTRVNERMDAIEMALIAKGATP
ncbi:MAG: serine/threonine-protein kinase [Verrucomicrobiae bacterium]